MSTGPEDQQQSVTITHQLSRVTSNHLQMQCYPSQAASSGSTYTNYHTDDCQICGNRAQTCKCLSHRLEDQNISNQQQQFQSNSINCQQQQPFVAHLSPTLSATSSNQSSISSNTFNLDSRYNTNDQDDYNQISSIHHHHTNNQQQQTQYIQINQQQQQQISSQHSDHHQFQISTGDGSDLLASDQQVTYSYNNNEDQQQHWTTNGLELDTRSDRLSSNVNGKLEQYGQQTLDLYQHKDAIQDFNNNNNNNDSSSNNYHQPGYLFQDNDNNEQLYVTNSSSNSSSSNSCNSINGQSIYCGNNNNNNGSNNKYHHNQQRDTFDQMDGTNYSNQIPANQQEQLSSFMPIGSNNDNNHQQLGPGIRLPTFQNQFNQLVQLSPEVDGQIAHHSPPEDQYDSTRHRVAHISEHSPIINCDRYLVSSTSPSDTSSQIPAAECSNYPGSRRFRSSKGRRGRPRKKGIRSKNKINGKLWEFIRDLLLSERTNPSFIRWERREDGVFKFVQSDKVAKMWGERKQNPKMTYEKLSRAMRYYYKSKVLLPVFGRRLVYKFGPNATGWLPCVNNSI